MLYTQAENSLGDPYELQTVFARKKQIIDGSSALVVSAMKSRNAPLRPATS